MQAVTAFLLVAAVAVSAKPADCTTTAAATTSAAPTYVPTAVGGDSNGNYNPYAPGKLPVTYRPTADGGNAYVVPASQLYSAGSSVAMISIASVLAALFA
ncbi:hypothetical protein BDR26DRAFT_853267 [Obelidium mucronatum]|nr:hypothetical protein BDR26DRAFT_853267 [Obelidium mucronatum]